MAITKIFNKTTSSDYQWMGVRLNNLQYSQTYNEGVNDGSINTKDYYKYYAYLPANLNYSTTEYETFIKDVNWQNGQPAALQSTVQPPARDWNSVETGLVVNPSQIEIAQLRWASVIDLTNVNATISFAYASLHRSASGVTYIGGNNTSVGGGNYQNEYVIFINYELYKPATIDGSVDTRDLSLGTWGGWTVMHELGHVWGLPHTPSPGKSDDLRFDIMNYPNSFLNDKIPLTPGMDNIAILQASNKFGQSHAQDGNTTYIFTQSSIDLGHGNILASVQTNVNINRYVLTISDRQGSEGGIDTIDASALATKVYINLNDGEFSAIGTDWNEAPDSGGNYNGKGNLDGDTKFNVGIAVGAEIENAKGGSADDYLKGNDLANTLEGNGGDDTLEGGKGVDTLIGGAGNDTYLYTTGDGFDTITDSDGNGSIKIDGNTVSGGAQIEGVNNFV